MRTETVGAPNLPSRLCRFVVPANIQVKDVEAVQVEYQQVEGEFLIPPTQPPIRTDGSEPPEPVDPDPAIYGSDAPFPSSTVELAGVGFSFGYQIVSLVINPLSYRPRSGTLKLLTKLEIRIDGPEVPSEHFSALRRSAQSAAVVRKTIARLVENDDQIDAFAPSTRIEDAQYICNDYGLNTTTLPSLEGFPVDYVIITSDMLAESFRPLAQWKQAKGLNTMICTIPDIEAHYTGVDTQEKIRNFIIKAGTMWGTTFFMLGGDVSQVPDRKGFWDYHSSSYGPTDLYYSTAEGNWNANGNAIFGEYNDGVDEEIDFYIGRAPVEMPSEVQLFVQKILDYEKSPPSGFIETALLAGASLSGNDTCGQDIKELIKDFFPESYFIWRLYNILDGGDELLTRESFLKHLNKGYHYNNQVDHSDIRAMGAGHVHGGGSITCNDVLDLTNGHRQGILFSLGCSPNAFDYESISEAFITNPKGGALAFMGNTRTGYSCQGPQDITFFQEVLIYDETCLGVAFSVARSSMTGSYYRHVMNLLGDPAMVLWTQEPDSLNVVHDGLLATGVEEFTIEVSDITSDNSGIAQSIPVEGAKVCLFKENEVFAIGWTDSDGQVTLEVVCNTQGTLLITVTAQNYLPYQAEVPVEIGPMPHLYVSDFVINDDLPGQSNGNGDTLPDAGETLEIELHITNGGSIPEEDVTAILTSFTPEVEVLEGLFNIGDVYPGQNHTVVTPPFVVEISPNCPDMKPAKLRVLMNNSSFKKSMHIDYITFTINAPQVGINSSTMVDDGSGNSQGNGNGIAEPEETIELYIELANTGHGMAREVTATASSNHQNIIIIDGNSYYGHIPAMTAAEPFDPIIVELTSDFVGDETLTLVVSDYYTDLGSFILDLCALPSPAGLGFSSCPENIYLTWQPVLADDLQGYNIYRSNSIHGPFTRLNELIQAGASLYWDTDVSPASIYYYCVTAVDTSGNEGEPSAILQAWTTYPYQPGWPINIGGLVISSAAVADVDFDGKREIFVGALDGKVYGFNSDGTEMFDLDNDPSTISGFAIKESIKGVWGAPSIGDLDNDGSPEIVATSRGRENKVYAWQVFDQDGDGAPDPLPGWPVQLEENSGYAISSPALGDVDQDEHLEVVFLSESGKVHVIDWEGKEEDGWPQGGLGSGSYATPALGDLDNNGDLEIIVGGKNGKIYAWHHDGTMVSGWPVETGMDIYSSPALGDIDGDGDLEILQNVKHLEVYGFLYALEANGTEVTGWEDGKPYSPRLGPLPSSPVLANIDDDERLEIFLGTLNGIAAWYSDGTSLPGWPVALSSNWGSRSSPAIADIDGDGMQEVIIGSGDRRVYCVELDGTVAHLWPVHTEWPVEASPTIEEVDNDGDLELIIAAGPKVYIWDCTDPYTIKDIQWGTFHADIKRSGLYNPALPISGTVFWPCGEPAPHVEIKLLAHESPGMWIDFTDSAGNYRFDVPAGSYEMRAYRRVDCTNYRAQKCQIIYNGFDPVTIDFTLQKTDIWYACKYANPMDSLSISSKNHLEDTQVSESEGVEVLPFRADLEGRITWNCGDPLEPAPHVIVTATKINSNETHIAETNAEGNYWFYMTPGWYHISAEIRANGTSYWANTYYVFVDGVNTVRVDMTLGNNAVKTIVCYLDSDGDGYGNPESCIRAPYCQGGYVEDNTDCNDNNHAINPEAPEICNDLDDNCDMNVDEGFKVGTLCTVGIGECQSTGQKICTQDGLSSECAAEPGEPSPEVCNGLDDNCNGLVDEEYAEDCVTYYKDGDQDGYGVDEDSRCLCSPDEDGGYIAIQGGDTDDFDPNVARIILGSCSFEAAITATDQANPGAANFSTVYIGIKANAMSFTNSGAPTDHRVYMELAGGLLEDYKETGSEYEEWKLIVRVKEKSDAGQAGFFPVLSWDPNDFCLPDPNAGLLSLYSEDLQGRRKLLIGNMYETNHYQTKEEDSQCLLNLNMFIFNYNIVWSKKREVYFEMHLPAGWSMVSLPVVPDSNLVTDLFPDAVVVYDYEMDIGYMRAKSLEAGQGYWILVKKDQDYILKGEPITEYTHTVYEDGWDIIGGCTYPAWASANTCNIKVIYGYIPYIGYQRVFESDFLEPGKGYWVLFNDVVDQCTLIVETMEL